ncbi:MAG: amidohydrolase family protein [Archangium sp.]
MKLVLRGGLLNGERTGDVSIIDGVISTQIDTDAHVVDVTGAWVVPGFIDLHSVVRDERDVDAALRGGFTTVVTVPLSQSIDSDRLQVLHASPLTQKLAGDELGEVDAQTVCLSQGFKPLPKAGVLRRALQYSPTTLLMLHAEDPSLAGQGVIGAGLTATRLGLPSVPVTAETAVIARDLLILEETGGRLHFSHVTTARGVELIRDAKRRGLKVSADVAPHHLTKDARIAEGYPLDARVWPPFRSEGDVAALRAGLADGTIDAIACDHVRVAALDREHPFEACLPGCEGFEQALPAAVACGLSAARLIDALSLAPARLLGLNAGLKPGLAASLTIIEPKDWTVRGTVIGTRHTFPAGVVP